MVLKKPCKLLYLTLTYLSSGPPQGGWNSNDSWLNQIGDTTFVVQSRRLFSSNGPSTRYRRHSGRNVHVHTLRFHIRFTTIITEKRHQRILLREVFQVYWFPIAVSIGKLVVCYFLVLAKLLQLLSSVIITPEAIG